MKKFLFFIMVLILSSAAAYADYCCKQGASCYDAAQTDCTAGIWHSGDCLFSDNCDVVYECMAGVTANCIDNTYNGTKTCNSDNVYGPCIIDDADYLALIDRDSDTDPDATDCAPDDPNTYWGHGCEAIEFYAPPTFVWDIASLIIKILIFIALVYAIYALWNMNKKSKK